MRIYKITKRGDLLVSEDGGQLWKQVEGIVINEQPIGFLEEMNKRKHCDVIQAQAVDPSADSARKHLISAMTRGYNH